ncbi:hypothetical protein [Achromobacter sp. Marseille-Q4954]|uniref:hypothetical protein n=1 Tax=Achromobacter sp. Marseille-Q4954 TaxID=2942203 RepID=UPI0020737644|nr:hypothetical protein [Achromobacter sp. Marseille-Q4954]
MSLTHFPPPVVAAKPVPALKRVEDAQVQEHDLNALEQAGLSQSDMRLYLAQREEFERRQLPQSPSLMAMHTRR